MASIKMRFEFALEREFLGVDEAHHDDDRDQAEGRDGRERGRERG